MQPGQGGVSFTMCHRLTRPKAHKTARTFSTVDDGDINNEELDRTIFMAGEKSYSDSTVSIKELTSSQRISTYPPPYQNVKAIHNKPMLSQKENSAVEYLALLNAFLTCSASKLSYRRQIMSSRVSDVTVLNAPIDSAANLELSAKTS